MNLKSVLLVVFVIIALLAIDFFSGNSKPYSEESKVLGKESYSKEPPFALSERIKIKLGKFDESVIGKKIYLKIVGDSTIEIRRLNNMGNIDLSRFMRKNGKIVFMEIALRKKNKSYLVKKICNVDFPKNKSNSKLVLDSISLTTFKDSTKTFEWKFNNQINFK